MESEGSRRQSPESRYTNNSYGFRPRRSAHQALKQVRKYAEAGYHYAVDMDLEKFFDTVNQSKPIVMYRHQ
ncbi:MAG: hypothetical protein LBT83_02755 [Tannerella sp.]|nr:hypothetical protein [Tannerella sp.]